MSSLPKFSKISHSKSTVNNLNKLLIRSGTQLSTDNYFNLIVAVTVTVTVRVRKCRHYLNLVK